MMREVLQEAEHGAAAIAKRVDRAWPSGRGSMCRFDGAWCFGRRGNRSFVDGLLLA